MSYDEIYRYVCGVVAEEYGVGADTLTPETDFGKDLDDSLELVAVLLACEERFALEIPEEEAMRLLTVGDLARYLDQRLNPV